MEPALGAGPGLDRWFVGVHFFCRCVEISRGGGPARQPKQGTEPCQFVSGQPWACHGGMQGNMQPLQCAAGVVEPALGVAAGLGRWFKTGAIFCRFVDISRAGGSTWGQPRRTDPCQCVSGQPWACHAGLQDHMQPLHWAAGVVEPTIEGEVELGR